jgi:exopolysaccharide biosynthesis predicted pyruvyltransferase EpsI
MAGGGNFNDYYWEDQPARMTMIRSFPNVPIRKFPQSVYMHWPERIAETQMAFATHSDLILAARDLPGWRWLHENLEQNLGIPSVLLPDIAFAWGNRSDIHLSTKNENKVLAYHIQARFPTTHSKDLRYSDSDTRR